MSAAAAAPLPSASRPDDDEFLSPTYVTNYRQQGDQVVAANSVATRTVVRAVAAALGSHLQGSPSDYLFALAVACRDQGSSPYASPEGSADSDNYPFADAVRLIRRHCTLRQLCMFYAPAVWNYTVDHSDPPANWLRKGYTFNTRYAAFDFFNGVTHPAAIALPSGLARPPTLEEIKANRLNAAGAILANRQSDQVTTAEAATFQRQVASSTPRPAIGWS